MRRIVVSFLVLVLLGGVMAAPIAAHPTSAYCADPQEQAFLNKINAYRAAKGLSALVSSQTLGAAADHHSIDMANKNYFSHTLKNGTTWSQNVKNHGYTATSTMGENIAAGNADALATFKQWKTSPEHNKNMLSKNYKAIGIGRAYNANSRYDWYWTTDFGGAADGAATTC